MVFLTFEQSIRRVRLNACQPAQCFRRFVFCRRRRWVVVETALPKINGYNGYQFLETRYRRFFFHWVKDGEGGARWRHALGFFASETPGGCSIAVQDPVADGDTPSS